MGQDAVVPCIVTGQPKVEVRGIRDDEVVRRDGKWGSLTAKVSNCIAACWLQ